MSLLLLGGCPEQQPETAADNETTAPASTASTAPDTSASTAPDTIASTAPAEVPSAVNMEDLQVFSDSLGADTAALLPLLLSFESFQEATEHGDMLVAKPCTAGFASETEYRAFHDLLQGDSFESYLRRDGEKISDGLVDEAGMRIVLLVRSAVTTDDAPYQVEMGLISFKDRAHFAEMLSGMQKQ